MAKIITPPHIMNLDGLLTLLINPEKGVAYLKQLQEMRDAIKASLDVVKTKEEADHAMAEATSMLAQAKASVHQAQEEIAKAKGQATKDLEMLKRQQADVQRAITEAQAGLTAREAKVAAAEQATLHRADAQAKHEQELKGQQIMLDGRAAHLEKEEARIAAIKTALAGHGV